MPKYLIIVILFVFYSFGATAQNNSLVLKSNQYNFSTTQESASKSVYLDYLVGKYYNNFGSQLDILRLDENLNTVDSLCISCLENVDTNLFVPPLLEFAYNQIYILALYRNADSLYHVLYESDTSLNIISKINLSFPYNKARFFFDIRDFTIHDSSIYLAGTRYDTVANYPDAHILKLDINGNFQNGHLLSSDSVQNGPRWIEYNSLYINDSIVLASLNGTTTEYLTVLDSSLNSLGSRSSLPSNYYILSSSHFLKKSRETPVLHAITFVQDLNRQPGPGEDYWYKNQSLLRLSSNFAISHRDTFAFTGWHIDTITFFKEEINAGTSSFSYNSEDTIITMATDFTSFPSTWPVFEQNNVSTNTYISAFDNVNQSVIWSQVHNNGFAHFAEEVTALPNNRWLLTFNEYDWNTYGPDNLAVRLIVIDGNGNPIGINEDEEKALAQEPIVYPNPAEEYLTIGNLYWLGNSYTYQISDLNGRVVQKGALPISGTIALSEEFIGIYVLTITNQTGFGWARKVVIE